MEILNEGFIPTRTIRATAQIILGFRPFRKKRRISKPREFNAKNGTPTRGALPFPPHRCHAQKNYGQNVEQNVSQTTHQLQSIRHPGPIKLRPWQKIQEQHQAHKLGTQRLKSLKKPIIHLHKNYYFAHYTRNTNEISNKNSNGHFHNKNKTNLYIAVKQKKNKNKVLIERFSGLYLNKWTPPLGCFVKYIPNISFEHQQHQHLEIKFLHEQYSNLYLENQNATVAASLQIYTEYFQRTVSTNSISNLYLKTITMLRVLRQIYTEYYHRNTNVTSHGLRHWPRNNSPITNE